MTPNPSFDFSYASRLRQAIGEDPNLLDYLDYLTVKLHPYDDKNVIITAVEVLIGELINVAMPEDLREALVEEEPPQPIRPPSSGDNVIDHLYQLTISPHLGERAVANLVKHIEGFMLSLPSFFTTAIMMAIILTTFDPWKVLRVTLIGENPDD